MIVKEFVKKFLPYPAQQWLKYIYGVIPPYFRYGKVFWDTYNFLQESQWWSREKLEEYQMQQLNKLLHHAYENVPYYRRIFDTRGLKPKDIQDFKDLRKLPFLTKDDVRKNLKDLIARNILQENIEYVTTGGSTATPTKFAILKQDTDMKRLAFEWRYWNWLGYKFGDRCVVLRGDVVKRKEDGNLAWWKYDRENNYLILSTYDMRKENLPYYLKKIEEFRPKVIRAYPSSIEILSRFIKREGFKINQNKYLKGISTTSETLFPGQRALIEEAFNCPVFDKLGHTELIIIAGQCEKGKGYHLSLEYGFTELVNLNGQPINQPNQIGEIVGTGFINEVLPLIRYRTGDLAAWAKNECSCGRHLPLFINLQGRAQELIVTKDGGVMTLTNFIWPQSRLLDNIYQLQFYQTKPGLVVVRIVKKPTYTEADTQALLQDFKQRTRERVNFKIEFVKEIPRTSRGKFNYLVQELDIKKFH